MQVKISLPNSEVILCSPGEVIKAFSFTMIIGVIIGTYSSMFIAIPTLMLFNFRRLNENASETREEFLPFAADVKIEFVLASEDPYGNPTTGITHTYTSETGFPYISIWDIFTGNITLNNVKSNATGGVDAWDTSKYLNSILKPQLRTQVPVCSIF